VAIERYRWVAGAGGEGVCVFVIVGGGGGHLRFG